MELRPYQISSVELVLAHLNERPILTLPTGAGKTVVAAEIIRRFHAEDPSRRTLWYVHRRELILQAEEHLSRAGLMCGIIMAGHSPRSLWPVQIASTQTLARRQVPKSDLIVVDEAHHVRSKTSQAVFEALPEAFRLGLTATPMRLDGRGLGQVFGKIIVGAYPDELVADGTLIAPTVYVPEAPRLQSIKIVAGDYHLGQLAREMDQRKLIGNIVDNWMKHGQGRKTVCFAVNVEHSKHIVARFIEAGVRAEHLDGNTPHVERQRMLARLRSGETTILSNCGIVNEGFDLPALEVAIIARPTASLTWHLQSIGRIARSAEGKAGALILDHAGNHLKHGEMTQRLEYSLADDVRVGGATRDSDPKVKRCPACFLLIDASEGQCPACGHIFVEEGRKNQWKEAEGTLVEYGKRADVPFDVMQRQWDTIEAKRQAFGFKSGWSFYQFRAMYGVSPTVHEGRLIDPRLAPASARQAEYQRLRKVATEKGYKDGWVGYKFKAKFGAWPTYKDRQ